MLMMMMMLRNIRKVVTTMLLIVMNVMMIKPTMMTLICIERLVEHVDRKLCQFTWIDDNYDRIVLYGRKIFNLVSMFTCSHFSISRGSSIGLLDMSGFENFPTNGFDQFLINVTNEKLQHYFMEYIFPREQKDYEIEGISWQDINYQTNEDVLDLLFQVCW